MWGHNTQRISRLPKGHASGTGPAALASHRPQHPRPSYAVAVSRIPPSPGVSQKRRVHPKKTTCLSLLGFRGTTDKKIPLRLTSDSRAAFPRPRLSPAAPPSPSRHAENFR